MDAGNINEADIWLAAPVWPELWVMGIGRTSCMQSAVGSLLEDSRPAPCSSAHSKTLALEEIERRPLFAGPLEAKGAWSRL